MRATALRHLLDAADDEALVLVAVGDVDAQDLQHRVREVRVPAAGAEADLAEHLAVAERQLRERSDVRDEVVEGAVVPAAAPAGSTGLERAASRSRIACLQVGEARRSPAPRSRPRPPRGTAAAGRRASRRSGSRPRGRSPCSRPPGVSGLGKGGSPGPACPRSGRSRWTRPGSACRPARRSRPRPPSKGCERSRPPRRAGLVDDGLQAHLHQLVGRRPCPAMPAPTMATSVPCALGGNRAKPGGMRDPVVEGEGEVRPEHGDGLRRVGFGKKQVGRGGHGFPVSVARGCAGRTLARLQGRRHGLG